MTSHHKLETGQLRATDGITAWGSEDDARGLWLAVAVSRHLRGDWGDVNGNDEAANNAAMRNGEPLTSTYPIPQELDPDPQEATVLVITEAADGNHPTERPATTIMWPSEY